MKKILLILIILLFNTIVFAQNNKDPRYSPNFETFLNYFLNTCFWGMNTDSLTNKSSRIITQFHCKEVPFSRYWNPGAYCSLFSSNNNYGYNFFDNYYGNCNPQKNNLKFIKEKQPVDGFCEESTSVDGIYYQSISSLPTYADLSKIDNYDTEINIPIKYKYSKKMVVSILYDKYIIKTMYFMQIEGVWQLVSFMDCDCSA